MRSRIGGRIRERVCVCECVCVCAWWWGGGWVQARRSAACLPRCSRPRVARPSIRSRCRRWRWMRCSRARQAAPRCARPVCAPHGTNAYPLWTPPHVASAYPFGIASWDECISLWHRLTGQMHIPMGGASLDKCISILAARAGGGSARGLHTGAAHRILLSAAAHWDMHSPIAGDRGRWRGCRRGRGRRPFGYAFPHRRGRGRRPCDSHLLCLRGAVAHCWCRDPVARAGASGVAGGARAMGGAPHGDMHSRIGAAWRCAFPYVRRMAMCIPVCAPHGDMHSRMCAAWQYALPYAHRMATCVLACTRHATNAYHNARRRFHATWYSRARGGRPAPAD